MSKVAVITGASGGIGAAVARRLAAQGCYVVLGYCRSREKAESLCRELREAGGEAVSFRADLTKAEEAKALIEFAVQQYGHLDILVNNAGISQIKLFTDITQEDWQRMFAANVDGIYHCCRAAVPYLVQQHSGTIINVSSIWGLCGASCEVHYSASKAAVIGFTQALAKELAPSGITVNCVADAGGGDPAGPYGLAGGSGGCHCLFGGGGCPLFYRAGPQPQWRHRNLTGKRGEYLWKYCKIPV